MKSIVALVLLLATVQAVFGEKDETSAAPNIVSRSEWGARAAKEPVENLPQTPVPYVVIHHSATAGCTTPAMCQAKVRSFQNYHMDTRNWTTIGYNFLVGEDGNVYEGRGWGKRGAHSVAFNPKSIGICIIGNFEDYAPDAAAINTTQSLISYGVSSGQIKSNYKLLGHRQTADTACPGRALYDEIKSWDRWSETA